MNCSVTNIFANDMISIYKKTIQFIEMYIEIVISVPFVTYYEYWYSPTLSSITDLL